MKIKAKYKKKLDFYKGWAFDTSSFWGKLKQKKLDWVNSITDERLEKDLQEFVRYDSLGEGLDDNIFGKEENVYLKGQRGYNITKGIWMDNAKRNGAMPTAHSLMADNTIPTWCIKECFHSYIKKKEKGCLKIFEELLSERST